jgi:hypothetical protein
MVGISGINAADIALRISIGIGGVMAMGLALGRRL